MTEQSKSSRENKQSTRGVLSWSSQFYEISYSSSKQMSSKCAVQHGYAYKVARYSFGNRSSIIHKIAFVWISTLESLVFTCRATQWAHPAHEIHHRSRGVGGGGGKRGGGWCLQGNRWFSSPASMTSRLAFVTFKMPNKVFIEETDKNFEFITTILFRFLGSGDFKIPIVIEKQTLVLFWNETSSGVINF